MVKKNLEGELKEFLEGFFEIGSLKKASIKRATKDKKDEIPQKLLMTD